MSLKLRLAQRQDIAQLVAVERSAAQLFRQQPELQFIAEGEVMSPQQHVGFIAQQREWVMASPTEQIAGFIAVQPFPHSWHIAELSVAADWQRQGVGKRLIEEIAGLALCQGMQRLTLTTFLQVAWNAPYYQRLGFRIIPVARLDAYLQHLLAQEMGQGLAVNSRCAMEFTLS
ncbi:N-acetyltransferase family protein [Serratia sp. 2723]|uniref:GNAT family N-acetyltransferase n=1 Tax=unclassified Serratia (in: enterobacteria) TaxID=2647522 RepID=UPI003D192189